ncbi:MAG: FAD-dependent oxidoreductase, partial [Alphaproteobacteria bacterium]|nr:FAD-dependent oxidoreductase [Alphaproteobacteria bacterium]
MMSADQQRYRLSVRDSARHQVDTTKPIRFTVDGKTYLGFKGDTLASALFANGVFLVGRSFKYHRPRGITALDESEPNALFHHHGMPNTRAGLIPLYDGLEVTSQNRFPSLENDVGALAGLFQRWLPAGFYYKTFIGPTWLGRNDRRWKFYEYFIRRAAGLGKAENSPEPGFFEHMHAYPDLLVVGSGISGITAALSAARRGKTVLLIDAKSLPGGDSLASAVEEKETLDELHPIEWAETLMAEFVATPGCTYLPNTTVTGIYDHGFAIAAESVADN